MAETLKQIECEPKCGFLVRSHDEKELIRIGMEHAENSSRHEGDRKRC